MSYVKLNIIDHARTIHDDVPIYFADALVASLTAEPENIDELETALKRFLKPVTDSSPFARFRDNENFEPFEAGTIVIDLSARTLAADSDEEILLLAGGVRVHSDFVKEEEEDDIYYHLSDDWMIAGSISDYLSIREQRRQERDSVPLIDAREVFYERELIEFICRECGEQTEVNEETPAKIHTKWMITPRESLNGRTPREILLDKRHFIDIDLQWRANQFTFTKECPAPLPITTNAYRYSGFGTHENVVYYDLVRDLLNERLKTSDVNRSIEEDIQHLEDFKTSWLASTNKDFAGRTPSQIIELERRRMNITISAKEAMFDDDCDACDEMFTDFDTAIFWHLDASGMDDTFEFSSHKTLEEYEEEKKRWEEFNRTFDEDYKAGKYDFPQDEPF